MKDSGVELPLPENPAPHVVAWMHRLGWTRSNGMDRVALTLGDIGPLHLIGAHPGAWEAGIMCRMSSEFLAESRQAESPSRKPPWSSQDGLIVDHAMEERQLRSVLG